MPTEHTIARGTMVYKSSRHQASDQGVLAQLAKEGWRPVRPGHALYRLQDRGLGKHYLGALLGPSNRVGAHYFQVRLRDKQGNLSRGFLLSGLHHSGDLPSHNWIEVMGTENHYEIDDHLFELSDEEELSLFQILAETVPPGGHLMVEYDSPERVETAKALSRGVPPILTPLGRMLFLVGCGAGFKDWYVSEGWTEGPRKLQGYKALDKQHAGEKGEELAQEVLSFLVKAGPRKSRLVGTVAERARDALNLLAMNRPELMKQVEDSLRALRLER